MRLEIDPRPVVLTGPNGAGKTNLLEAISFLAPGRGLRGARLAEVDRDRGGGAWTVAARLEGPRGAVDLGDRARRRTASASAAPSDRRRSAASQAALAEIAAVVWLTPAMDRLFSEGAGARRRFLDRLVLAGDPAHAGQIVALQPWRCASARGCCATGRVEPAWLGALEEPASPPPASPSPPPGAQTIRGLERRLAADAPGWLPAARARARTARSRRWLDELPALDAEARFAETLAAPRGARTPRPAARRPARIAATSWCASAPAAGRPRDCSTGEQKALLIAIVLAEARLRAAEGERQPILLLDEVAAHLDPARRGALFEELCALGAQAWLTGTEAARLRAVRRAGAVLLACGIRPTAAP